MWNQSLAKKIGLNAKEISLLKKLSTPQKIQDYIIKLKANLEKGGETLMSPREVLKNKTCHCIEGALLAALALWLHGGEPLLIDMQSKPHDLDHVIAPFKVNGLWGAISKTNHIVLRYRDPVYKNLRELMMSYFHEFYILKTGEKTLLSYSKPFNLKSLRKSSWVTTKEKLLFLEERLNKQKHFPFVLKKKIALRKADDFEKRIGSQAEYR